MLNICLTFDYELFFGSNFGTDDEILFNPTAKLVSMLEKNGVSATFFADTCSVFACRKNGREHYANKFDQQIKYMVTHGQDVQLHIHPHWMTSVFDGEAWNFDSTKYSIHSFGFDESKADSAINIIQDGINHLTETLTPVKPDYRCFAYRAGGFVMQPHGELFKCLIQNGIKIDSSAAPMLAGRSATHSYDYTNPPKITNWYISPNSAWNIEASSDNSLYEIPIATENKNLITFPFKKIFAPKSVKSEYGKKRGTYMNEKVFSTPSRPKLKAIINYLLSFSALSADSDSADFLHKQAVRYYRKHKLCKSDATFAVIGHPKLITDEYIDNLESFIRLVKSDKRMRFSSFSEVYNKIGGTK